MFRFTIRDLIWLTVVVALLLVVAIGYVSRVRMESDIRHFKTEYIAIRDRAEAARVDGYQRDIFNLSGKRVTEEHFRVDPTNIRKLICDFVYDEPAQSTADAAPEKSKE